MPPYFPVDDRMLATILDEQQEGPMDEDDSGLEPVPGPARSMTKSCDDGPRNDDGSTTSFRRPGEKKHVSFQLSGRMRYIKSLKRLASQEKAEIWMTADDYERTQAEAKDDSRKLNEEGFGECIFSTGVESVHRYQQRRGTQEAATKAVLKEQSTQHLGGYACEDLIAMVYEEHSNSARMRAYLAGVMMRIESQN